MVSPPDKTISELLDFLRARFELPQNIQWLKLEIRADEPVSIECGYKPEKRDIEEKQDWLVTQKTLSGEEKEYVVDVTKLCAHDKDYRNA